MMNINIATSLHRIVWSWRQGLRAIDSDVAYQLFEKENSRILLIVALVNTSKSSMNWISSAERFDMCFHNLQCRLNCKNSMIIVNRYGWKRSSCPRPLLMQPVQETLIITKKEGDSKDWLIQPVQVSLKPKYFMACLRKSLLTRPYAFWRSF